MSFKNAIDDLQKIDGEDFKRIGTGPIALRGALIIAGCAVVIGAVTHFMIKPQFAELERAEAKEVIGCQRPRGAVFQAGAGSTQGVLRRVSDPGQRHG